MAPDPRCESGDRSIVLFMCEEGGTESFTVKEHFLFKCKKVSFSLFYINSKKKRQHKPVILPIWLTSLRPPCPRKGTFYSKKKKSSLVITSETSSLCFSKILKLSTVHTSCGHFSMIFLTNFLQSVEAFPASAVSVFFLVSRGGVLADSWGIWRLQEPHCPACRSLCRWPSSRKGPHLCRPRWHWRTREESPGPPLRTDQEPWEEAEQSNWSLLVEHSSSKYMDEMKGFSRDCLRSCWY